MTLDAAMQPVDGWPDANIGGAVEGAHMVETGFIRPAHEHIIMAERELDLLLERMAAHQPHEPIFAMKVADL